MMEEINSLLGGSLSFVNDPIIQVSLVLLGLILMYFYMQYKNMPNNPYLIDTIIKNFAPNMLKNKYRMITVIYLRSTSDNNIVIQAIRRELLGKKGLYMKYNDVVENIPNEYYNTGAGDDDVLYYMMTEANVGYPIKPIVFKEDEEVKQKLEEVKEDKPFIAMILASKKKHDLFTTQHFKELSQGIKTRSGRSKTSLDRLIESGLPALFFVTVILMFAFVYMYATDSTKSINTTASGIYGDVYKIYSSFIERDRYCQVFIARYGTEADLDKYTSMPTGFETMNQTATS